MPVTLTACVDGKIVEPEQASIPATDDGLLRGDGVFEVIRVYRGLPFGLAAHLDRLESSSRAIELPVDRVAFERDAELALEQAGPRDAALRLVATRGGHRVVFVEELPERPASASLAAITYAVNPILEGVKSISYAGNMQATRLARARDADEALFVRGDGIVLEAPTAAVFWASAGSLFTPELRNGILASITRKVIVDALEVEEGRYALSDLLAADEAFLASTTREVQPVSAIDGSALPVIDGECTRRAAAALGAAIVAELGDAVSAPESAG